MSQFIKSCIRTAGVLALLGGAILSGGAQTVVSPNSLATTAGAASNLFPFSPSSIQNVRSLRYQQVYNAGEFSALAGPFVIRQIAFRPNYSSGNAFMGNIASIQINLSTTAKAADQLSPRFSENIGADETIVYSLGPLALSSSDTDLGNAYAFDIVITLTQPFTYDPANGNLLLDVQNFSGSYATPLDAQKSPTDGVSRVYATDVNAATGTADTLGLTTQFLSSIGHTVAGTVTLADSLNAQQLITFVFRNANTTIAPITVTQTLAPTTASSGTFSISGIPTGNYSLQIKGPTSLATAQSLSLAADALNVTTTLLAGDADNSNTCDVLDFGILVNAYGSLLSDPTSGYDPQADFNNDGAVDVLDFGLLVNVYGQSGAP